MATTSATTMSTVTNQDEGTNSNNGKFIILGIILIILVCLIIAVVIVGKFSVKKQYLENKIVFGKFIAIVFAVRRRRRKMLTLTTVDSNRSTIKTDDTPSRSQVKDTIQAPVP